MNFRLEFVIADADLLVAWGGVCVCVFSDGGNFEFGVYHEGKAA